MRFVCRRLNWSKMCERIGAMPAPPPMKHISAFVSRAKNSPKGPETVTSSPSFRLKTQELMMPGGMSSLYPGGKAMRMVKSRIPFSLG